MPALDLSQVIINSVITGSIYVLVAIGLTMIYRVLKFANFSHAELVTFGAYMSYIVNVSMGLSIFYGLVAAFLLTGILGIATDRLVFTTHPLAISMAIIIPTTNHFFMIKPPKRILDNMPV